MTCFECYTFLKDNVYHHTQLMHPVFFWLLIFSGKGTRVCIVGGGFGGLYTALQLAQLLPLQPEGERAKITLVDIGERCDMCNLQYPYLAAFPDARKTCTPA